MKRLRHLLIPILAQIINYTVVYGDDSSWVDSVGRSCADYTSGSLCLNGSYGPKWRYDKYGLFKHFADDNGFDASDRCCECILSSSPYFIAQSCAREEDNESLVWYDVIGHTCLFYDDNQWCENFHYGKSRI